MGMNSQWARDKAINLMNEEGKEVTVEFLMNHLAVEDGNTQHKFLSQLNSNSSMNFAAYDRRQNRRKSNRSKHTSGKNEAQNKTRVQTSSSNSQLSRKPPGMEGKCMRCGKPEHQPGPKCTAKNDKCKDCHKIGHFYKVCQSKKKARRANLAQVAPQTEQDTHIDENGVRQPNPPMVNMLKIVNHIGATSGSQEKHLKFPIDVDPRGPYKHHLVVRVDTGADVNCMNEKTFKKLYPEVKLSVCPHEIQNFGNSVVDISILGQFCTYLQFRGEKYLNTFIVTNANDCPNLLSHGATFRMGVLLPNYTKENVVKACGENVPNFKYSTSTSTSTGTSSNVFQILQDLWLKQYQENHPDSLQNESRTSHTSTHSMTGTTAQSTTSFRTCRSSTVKNERMTTGTIMQNITQSTTSFRTTTPTRDTTGRTNTFRTTPNTRQQVPVPHDTSCTRHLECCMHVQQPKSQVCKLGESLALRKVKHPLSGKTSVNRLPLTKQDTLSQYSGCFEGIGHFPADLYKFHLRPDHKHPRHAPRKVPAHLETAFKEEIESLVKQGILEEVKEHTDWVNSYVIVEKDTGNHHSPNHTVKKKLRICLDPRDLNEALEREPYYTHSTGEITAKFPNRDRMEHAGHFPTSMEMCMDNHLTLTTDKTQRRHFQDKTSEQSCSAHSPQKKIVHSHAEFPPDMENIPIFPGKQFLQGKENFVDICTFTLGTIILINLLNRYSALSTLTHQATDYKPGRVHQNFQ